MPPGEFSSDLKIIYRQPLKSLIVDKIMIEDFFSELLLELLILTEA